MNIKYLGTGAAEGIPAVFCHCNVCEDARKYKGKHIRTRSQALIDGKILLDFGPDTYMHSLQYNINLADINVCFITHSHDDHLYIEDIRARRRSRANLRNGTEPLVVYGGKGVKEALKPKEDGYITKDGSVKFIQLKTFEEVEVLEDYYITAIPAMHKTVEPFVYIIKHDNRTFLYAHDTDYFEETVWNFFKDNHIYFDAISLDCTEGIKHIEYPGHMNFERMQIICNRFLKEKCIDINTKVIANHISHNGLVTYDEAVKVASTMGYLVSFDGLELTI